MKTVNIQEAKEDLARLLEEAPKGEPFVVIQDGKPSLKVVRVEETNTVEAPKRKRQIGILDGQYKIPDDLDTMMAKEIEEMFSGK